MKDNPLALQVLMEGKIDLRDKRIRVDQLNMEDQALLGNVEGVHSISLGCVDVLPLNSILLEDVDVNNIPEDKNIIIQKNTKTLYAVGKKVKITSPRLTTTTTTSDDDTDNKRTSKDKYELLVKKKIFEELSFDEYKNKYLWNFEKEFATFDMTMLLRLLIASIPAIIVCSIFFQTVIELYKCKRDVTLMEE